MSDSWPLFYFKMLLALLIGGASGKEPGCQCRRPKRRGFDPCVGKIPWRRARQPTPVFLPGESPWTEEPWGLKSIVLQKVRYDWSDLACLHVASVCLDFFFVCLVFKEIFPEWLYSILHSHQYMRDLVSLHPCHCCHCFLFYPFLHIDIVAVKILVFSADQGQIKNYGEFGGNRKTTLIFNWQRGDTEGLCLKNCVPLLGELGEVILSDRGMW